VIPLGLEPGHKNVMRRPPNKPTDPILNKKSLGLMIILSVMTGGITLGVYYYFLNIHELVYARTLTFLTLIFIQMVIAWTVRSFHTSIFRYRVRNWLFAAAVIVSLAVQALITFTPFGEFLFKLEDVKWEDFLDVLIVVFIIVIMATEIYKFIIGRLGRGRGDSRRGEERRIK
jgi:Ca2+-transporting ATPase